MIMKAMKEPVGMALLTAIDRAHASSNVVGVG